MLPLKEKYKKEVILQMVEKGGYKNIMAVPKIEKVVLNIGFGKMMSEKVPGAKKNLDETILKDFALISGQRPILTKAKKSISAFKLRKGLPVGAKVTLRGQKMYDFLDRLIHIALPRSRDFRGIPESAVDKSGNLTVGIKEHNIFAEVPPERTKNILGLEITVVTSTKKRERGLELLKTMGFPIK